MQFIKLPYEVLRNIRKLKLADLKVLIILSKYWQWTEYVEIKKIANETGLTLQSVYNGLRRLKERSLIKKKGSKRKVFISYNKEIPLDEKRSSEMTTLKDEIDNLLSKLEDD